MLESVLADVLTKVLGQYLEGIDRESVSFGAWSGLVELRNVALRPEALAVLFETLGINLPVTVEAGFIGLLRLTVPWNAIGTTPVQITMEDITIMARPVRGDGSDDSELELRERRIKRARLDTDDAVREASWGVSSETETKPTASWSSWLVSDELRAKIIDNIQVHLKDIIIRFEDPFSDSRRPYFTSVVCQSLKIVSADEMWEEAFVERGNDAITRKLIEVKGFHVDWAPITPMNEPGLSRGTSDHTSTGTKRFQTLETLKQFIIRDTNIFASDYGQAGLSSIIMPVDGFMRILLSPNHELEISSIDLHQLKPAVDLDIRFPSVTCNLNDVQYTSLLQTSVYLARISTRGIRPKSPKARWVWAVDQLLPGFSARRAMALRLSEQGIAATRSKRMLYTAYRTSLLKARRTGLEEPKEIAQELENMEACTAYEEVIAFRDWVDRQVEVEGVEWRSETQKEKPPPSVQQDGTTTSTFWRMLGYGSQQSQGSSSTGERLETKELTVVDKLSKPQKLESGNESSKKEQQSVLSLRVAFVLHGVTVNLAEGGFPHRSCPRLSLSLQNLRVGFLLSSHNDLIAEAVLGSVEVWDVAKSIPLVYNRFHVGEKQQPFLADSLQSAYPMDIGEAIESIRDGSNPASDVLMQEDTYSDYESQAFTTDVAAELNRPSSPSSSSAHSASPARTGRRRGKSRVSVSRDVTPPTFRVTEDEFLGSSKGTSGLRSNAAAFRYTKRKRRTGGEGSAAPVTTLDVSIATLEAVVDGPKGSFIWGLKFWRPRGLAQDPIMAFLGAAAGARIAELRMEIEEALLANKVPLQINAVILAPRFIIPGTNEQSPALVVNMGTLGVCTSDHSPAFVSQERVVSRRGVRYSNYVMTLDNLGVYFCPSLKIAVSKPLGRSTMNMGNPDLLLDGSCAGVDTSGVERIIRPFSLRFMLQTLRDASVVQVAHHPSHQGTWEEDKIAIVRIRGRIPEVSLILSQGAFQHLLVTVEKWSRELLPKSTENIGQDQSSSYSWPVSSPSERSSLRQIPVQGNKRLSETQGQVHEALPTALASYDISVLLRKVSIELRERANVRLLTVTASQIQGNVIKTGRTNLQAWFSLQSWSVTDSSRGSTAAYRRLAYAGNLSGSKGVSPPRSLSGAQDAHEEDVEEDQNFITIRYKLDFPTKRQRIHIHFLSLHVICVRETYIRLAKYFRTVRKYVKASRVQGTTPSGYGALVEEKEPVLWDSSTNSPVSKESQAQTGLAVLETYICSEFDGLNCQLIAKGGAVALLEMKESKIQYQRGKENMARAWGECRYFAVRDLTSPLRDHVPVITYEKSDLSTDRVSATDQGLENQFTRDHVANTRDEWVLSIPRSKNGNYDLRANFRGIKITFLYRFCDVVSQYFKVLWHHLKPILDIIVDTHETAQAHVQNDHPNSFSQQARRFSCNLGLDDLAVRLPRHSACSSEAVNIHIPSVHVSNAIDNGEELLWNCSFADAQFATEYILQDVSTGPVSVSSSFLTNFVAELVVKSVNQSSLCASSSSRTEVLFNAYRGLYMNLSEAQYTILYFVLTENLVETVTELDLSLGIDSPDHDTHNQENKTDMEDSKAPDFKKEVSFLPVVDGDIDPRMDTSKGSFLETFTVIASVPMFVLEVSRGWDVTQESCKILGVRLKNCKTILRRFIPARLVLEVEAKLLSLEDLRSESKRQISEFAVPLSAEVEPGSFNSGAAMDTLQNYSMVYDKVGTDRPSIVMLLSSLQIDMPLDLLRDLTYLAIPGWPFLSSSSFPPEFTYVGRTLSIVLSDSQLLLRTHQHQSDRRALAMVGEFEVKMEWMRHTGAKIVSLQTKQMEISCVEEIQSLQEEYDILGAKVLSAKPIEASKTPLLYPTNCFVEYVGPQVDDNGCRLSLSSEAFLCLVNVGDIHLLRAVSEELLRNQPSYISKRNWKHPAGFPGQFSADPTPKEERRRKALESLNVSVAISALRGILSDDSSGQFVPVLETKLSSLRFNSHGESMVQVEGEISVDLFNSQKGWWEPALEPWHLSASMSQGSSGSVSYIIRSDQRANFNITPTTIHAVPTVLRTLSAASTKTSSPVRTRSQRLRLYGADASRRPAVAAFFVKNELGIPINMNLPSSSHRLTISHGSEIEIGAQSESLVSSGTDDQEMSRESALRCSLTISSYFSKTVSAGEVGLFPLTFFPTNGVKEKPARKPLYALWEVRMSNGVPLCTVRSQYRVVNRTKCPMELLISKEEAESPETNVLGDGIIHLNQDESFSVPIQDIKSGIAIRPLNPMGNDRSSIFDWSMPLPSMKWLRRVARMSHQNAESKASYKGKQKSHSHEVFLTCKALGNSQCDFFVKIVPSSSHLFGTNRPLKHGWIDVSLLAPVVLQNNLPRSVYYKVSRNDKFGLNQSDSSNSFGETIFAAGRVNPFEAKQLHFTGENMNYSLLSLAFDNAPTSLTRRRTSVPDFGPPVVLSDIDNGKVKSIFPSPENESTDPRRQARNDFRCLVHPDKQNSGKFSISAGVWVRNRSDTTLELCSRGSFYSGVSQPIILRQRPPFEEPDEFVCFEGPYLSVRIPIHGREPRLDDSPDSSSWWTTPSSIHDMKKPVLINISRRSLVLDVRPADGLEQSKIITIRNQSWILNSSMKPLQWCQASSLDAHGNCPTRSVSMLDPGRASAVHWETRSSHKAIHLRLSTQDGYSDWIWSPAVPLNIGFSRELPAKMYRPKTHEQHIARVDSKKIGGGSRALIVFPEDRQNPPYRIVNLCTERAVSFSQIGSHERPWLVRGGKSTRYSWDDPLAPPSKRILSVRILEKKDLREARSGLANPAHEAFELSIDVVGERVVVLSEGYEPTLVISVSVQGATKIVTFADEGSQGESHSRELGATVSRESAARVSTPVPVVAWDDISHTTDRNRSQPTDIFQRESLATLSDYPPKPESKPERPVIVTNGNTNTAVYLDSIGISVIDAEPSELIYARAHGILMNVESNLDTQVASVHIQEFQIDNQLHQTTYPVLLSVTNPQADVVQSSSGDLYAESGAIAFAIHRQITDGDIVMIKSFQSAINPFHLCFEDKIILKMLRFLSDTSIVGCSTPMDVNGTTDEDFRVFQTLLPASPNSNGNFASRRHTGSLPSSRRLYVHDFKINSSVLRLTSAGSGAAVAKAAGLGLTVSTILGLILNVENCEFQLAALQVQNVFDSLHHFTALVREYYITQLSNQRMKLLASNALVGNPAALFDAVGTGAKDFFNESGKAKGSAEFIASVGRGSKSLLSHTVGGIMESVSGIPRAVSSGLEKAVGDNAYLAERQRIRMGSGSRGSASKNPAQGFATGALSFAHGISSGVTGFIREPMQGAKQGGAGGLLKGIGKAFIGGVAKPVAGAIDFIAEPAAGLSRQIADDRAWVASVAERPPRAFRGESKRLGRYDRRYAVGVCLYKAVKEYNSIALDTDLLDWVELSDRDGRSNEGSDLWAWEIIRQYARSMPGWKKTSNNSQRGSRAASSTETRVEKTRVAMTTESDILVATMDCKLVAWITLWCDAKYDVWSDGKDLVISGRMGETLGGDETRGGATGGGNLVNAPWDAPYVERKRRPRAGGRFEERVACGSAAASDDLRRQVIQTVRLLEEEREGKPGVWRSAENASQSQELFALGSGGGGDNEVEMQGGVRKSSAGVLELGRLGRAASGGWRGRGETASKDRRSASLERTVRRLSSSRRPSGRGGLRFIVVNKLETHMTLVMRKEQLLGTTWSEGVAREIEPYDAQAMETKSVENGDEITGCVVYAVVDEKKEQVGEVAIELFCGRDGAASFTTKSSHGFHATFEREGRHGAFVFEVHETPGQEGEVEKPVLEKARRMPVEASSDEHMVQQLVDIGFSLDDAVVALAEAEGDMVKAVDILTRK